MRVCPRGSRLTVFSLMQPFYIQVMAIKKHLHKGADIVLLRFCIIIQEHNYSLIKCSK